MSAPPAPSARGYQGALEIFSRLTNHRPFVQGELRNFIREFEKKREDREVEALFQVQARVTELRDLGLPQLLDKGKGGEGGKLLAALQVSQSMLEKVLEQGETGEVELTLATSRETRKREWKEFQLEAAITCKRREEATREQEEAIRRRYRQLQVEGGE